MGILRRKVVHGEDCSEDESAILKNFSRLEIHNPLTLELQNDIGNHFPQEYVEASLEIVTGEAFFRGGFPVDITDRRSVLLFEASEGFTTS